MGIFVQYLVNGLSLGSIYGLMAVGLTLIFGAARIGNFAQADFFMIGGFVLYMLASTDLPYLVAALIALGAVIALSITSYFVVFRPVLDRGNDLTLFVAAIGLSILLESGATQIWGPTPRSTTISISLTRISVGSVVISAPRLIALGGAVVAFALLHMFLVRTRSGKAIRAVSLNPEVAAVVGISRERVRVTTFALSGAMAALAAVLIAPIYPVYPLVGVTLVLKAFAIVIMGGLGSVPGAILASFALGIVESLSAGYIATSIQDVMAFLAMIVILLVRPSGIFASPERV